MTLRMCRRLWMAQLLYQPVQGRFAAAALVATRMDLGRQVSSSFSPLPSIAMG